MEKKNDLNDSQHELLNPVYREICELLGIEVTEKIHQVFKGQQISFPVRMYSRDALYSMIRDEYDGSNIRALAAKYGYSEKTVRRILKFYDAVDKKDQ